MARAFEMIAAGVGLMGDFAGSAVIFAREDARIDLNENVGDSFARNLVTFRAETRVGFGILRPLAFTELDLTA